jgi:hypothetical protein
VFHLNSKCFDESPPEERLDALLSPIPRFAFTRPYFCIRSNIARENLINTASPDVYSLAVGVWGFVDERSCAGVNARRRNASLPHHYRRNIPRGSRAYIWSRFFLLLLLLFAAGGQQGHGSGVRCVTWHRSIVDEHQTGLFREGQR